MNERWVWVVRYVVVIVLAVVLAWALGELDLFKTTKLGKSGFSAARLVQFLGYGGALAVFWLLADRASSLMPSSDEVWKVVKNVLVPLATLIVVACGQAVLLFVLGPLMNSAWHQAYNWVAIVAIILSAAWLVVALFTGSSSLSRLVGAAGRRSGKNERQE